ncbi:MAG TPA: FliH/SctL family protein [Candidatus Baltobacteraceae bacterium]|nr:FliH/SctL family protein [Candidatus Baltobacteraceae bacterium]
MGKIYKSAKVAGQKYVVAVPHIDLQASPAAKDAELDARFAAPYAAPDAFETLGGDGSPSAPEVAAAVPAIDWDEVRADAEAIIDRASADARALIELAEAAARSLIEEAQTHAKLLEEDARAAGHDEGFEAGKAAADASMVEMIATMHHLLEELRDERHAMMQSAEPELVRLAMAVAERVVHSHIALEPNVVVENVRNALTRLVGREVVTLRVNPADLETMREHRDAIVAASDLEHVRIVEDQRVDHGGVMVETDSGTIDAKIATQLREARRAIRAEESISLGPSPEEDVLHSSAQAS